MPARALDSTFSQSWKGLINLPCEGHMHDLISTVMPDVKLYIDTISHLSRMHFKKLPKCFYSASLESCTWLALSWQRWIENIWAGGLMAAGCVNSPGLRHLVSIHLDFLCHLQAFCMHAAEAGVWKTGWTSCPQLSCLWGKKEHCLWLQNCLAWGQHLYLFRPPDLAHGSGTFTACFFSFFTCFKACRFSVTGINT